MSKHITVLQNDPEYKKFLVELLTEHGYKTEAVDNEIKLLNDLAKLNTDLIISSYNLPSIDGESFYKKICEEYPKLPVIFITNVKDENILTALLKYETCELMVKPVVPAELLARIKVFLTPPKESSENGKTIIISDLTLDLETKRAKRGDKELILTPTEFKLLEYLMSNKSAVLSRDAILSKVWGTTSDVTDRIVDVYIGYLREKIDNGNKVKLIQTLPGFGYSISD